MDSYLNDDSAALSISLSVSKGSLSEEMSISEASLEEAVSRSGESISNERIRSGDHLLDTYEVRSEAIRGGMGSVWRVHHESWDVDLAMKRPQPRFFAEGSGKRKEEFIRECENWINLGLHPNIVSCYYVREIGGVPTIFSEWMEGGSLKDRISDGSLYEGTQAEVQRRILDIAIQSLRGLQYSHENHLIHQDIKPGNLMLTKTWEAKVADFGLARAREKLQDEVSGRDVLPTGYTPAYCPKEQTEGGEAQEWMDTYAWALTVLEMYAGERFWKTGAEAFPLLFDGEGSGLERAWRIELPRKLLEVLREDYLAGAGKWRDPADMETILSQIYTETTGSPYFRESFNAASHSSDSLNNMALSYLDLGKHEEAERLWEKAAALDFAHPDTLYNHALYKWISGRETDLHLLDEIDKVTDPERRLELHRKAAAMRHELTDGMRPEEYKPPVNREDLTDLNSVWVGDAQGIYGKGTVCDWVLGRTGVTEEKPSSLYSMSPDGEKLIREGGSGALFPVVTGPSPSADGSVLVFCFRSRLQVYSPAEQAIVVTKRFPKESILSCSGAGDGKSCYLGMKDGLYEYFFETEEMRLLLSADSGIYNIKMRCGGKILLLCDGQNRLMVMDRLRNKVTLTIPTRLPDKQRFYDVFDCQSTFDVTDQDTVLFCGIGNQLFRYDLTTGELLSEMTAGDAESRIWDVRGRFIITGHYNNCQIWDSQKKSCLRSFRAHALQQACFWNSETVSGETDGKDRLSGFFLSGFPSRFRHFHIPAALPEPVWSLCRIRSTAEQTGQDTEFENHIGESRRALQEEDYGKALRELSLARELPNKKNAPECWALYDALFPHFQRGEFADCTVIYDFGTEEFPNLAPSLGPDGSWLYKDVWRGEGEILSTADGHCMKKFPPAEAVRLSCRNTRLTCIVRGSGKKHWVADVYSLPDGEKLTSQAFTSGGKPGLELIWTEAEREIIAVTVPGLFGGKVRMYIDPEKGTVTGKEQSGPHPLIAAARKNGMPYSYSRQKLPDGKTAFLYDMDDESLGRHKRIDIYGKSCELLGRYDFKNTNRASSDDIIRAALMPQDYLAGECGHALTLYRTSDFMEPGAPEGQALPLPAPIGNTSMSEDCRILFNGGRICRMEWELH